MTESCFDSVWDAIEDTAADARSMQARADIMIAVQEEVRRWSVSPKEAAQRLGITRPRLDEVLRGKIDNFTLEALLDLAHSAGLDVAWSIRPRAA